MALPTSWGARLPFRAACRGGSGSPGPQGSPYVEHMDASTRSALRISATYFILGALWVLLSDRVVGWLVPVGERMLVQTVKGWVFMAFVSVLLFSWVRREIRTRERSREALRATEANLAILLNQSLTGVFVVEDDRLTYANDRLHEILGRAPGELVGRSIASVVDEGDRARVLAQLERTSRRQQRRLLGFRALRADGATVHAEAQTTLTELGGREVVLGVLLDVTQRKVEEARYVAARRLEAIGRMAGGVAHDFNNLLTGITGAAQLLKSRRDLSPESREDLQVILDTAERGAALSRQLLAFSRSRVQHAEPVDVTDIVRGMQPLLRRLMHEKVRFEFELEPEPPPILADRHQIEQVVLNLAVNARDAMPNGGILRLTTATLLAEAAPPEARAIAGGDRLLRLTVEDTGVGIPRELRGRVFEPFFTTKGEHGTGLGLATVQGIIAQTSGHILLESAPGRTCFSVYFPTTDQPVGDRTTPADGRTGDGRPRGRVLVVEDEPVVRAITRRALERAGFPVVEAEDGAAARRALAGSDSFSVVLLDMTLPDESGVDIARTIVEADDPPAIVFMSGYSTEDLLLPDDVRPAGFVEKPFTVDEIARAVLRACP